MWHKAGLIYFRNSIKAMPRNSLFTCYYLDWDDKVGRARPIPPSSWNYRSFQLFGVSLTLFVEPTLLYQCYLFSTSDHHENKNMTFVCLTSAGTVLVCVSIPYVWFFMRKSGPLRFINYFESVLTLDKQFQGTVFIKM